MHGTAKLSHQTDWLYLQPAGGTVDIAYNNVLETSSSNYVDSLPNNVQVTLSAVEEIDGARFLYWTNENNRVISTNTSYKFYLGHSRTINAIFAETSVTSQQYYVVFKDCNGKILKSGYHTVGSTVVAPTREELGNFTGMVFTGWDTDEYQNVQKNLVVTAVYTTDTNTQLSLEYSHAAVNTSGTTFMYGDKVTVSLNKTAVPENQYFLGWSFDDGATISSYLETYIFHIYESKTITPVFTDTPDVKSVPIVTAYTTIDMQNEKINIITTREIPNGFTVTAHGFIVTKNSAYEVMLTLDAVDGSNVILRTATDYTYENGDYRAATTASGGTSVYYVGYITYVDDITGNNYTLYTDVYKTTMPYVGN